MENQIDQKVARKSRPKSDIIGKYVSYDSGDSWKSWTLNDELEFRILVRDSEEMIENDGEKDTESESKMGFQFHFLALQENSNDFEPKQLAIDPSTKVSQNFQKVAFFLKI